MRFQVALVFLWVMAASCFGCTYEFGRTWTDGGSDQGKRLDNGSTRDTKLVVDRTRPDGHPLDQKVTTDKAPSADKAGCGNGTIETSRGEECDGNALGGKSCKSFGFSAGNLVCKPKVCRFDYSGCSRTWDLTKDYSAAANPSGQWVYGWRLAAGKTFFPLTLVDSSGSSKVYWRDPGLRQLQGSPYVWKNTTSTRQTGVDPGQVSLHPGSYGQRMVVRWRAPWAGTCDIKGQFFAGDSGGMTGQVLVNGTMVSTFTKTSSSSTFNLANRKLAPGDTVEFVVFPSGTTSWSFGNTPLSASINCVPTGALPTCSDKQQNGDETDVDCGGRSCGDCVDGKVCLADGDCQSKICATALRCVPSKGLSFWLRTDGALTCDGGTCANKATVTGVDDCSTSKHAMARVSTSTGPRLDSRLFDNGKAAFYFDSSKDQRIKTKNKVSLHNGVKAYTQFAVVKPDSVQNTDAAVADFSHSNCQNIVMMQNGSSTNVFCLPRQTLSTAAFQVLTCGMDHTASSPVDVSALNGVTKTAGATCSSLTTKEPELFCLGGVCDDSKTRNFAGHLAEYLVYGRALSVAERQAVEAYLKVKFGL